MRPRSYIVILRLISLTLISAAVLLTVLQLVAFSRVRSKFPPGMIIAGVQVGGLNQPQAADLLTQIYSLPIELYYEDAAINMKPSIAGFELDLGTMLIAAGIQRVSQPFWEEFWDHLWNRTSTPPEIPIMSSISEERLRDYLENEISARYDRPPTPALSPSGSVAFEPGQPGTVLDIERAINLIEDSLNSPTNREVRLTFDRIAPPRPSLDNLQILMERILELSEFEGIAEIYMLDLQTRQEMNFAVQGNEEITPGVTFTAASTMKIPIMVSMFRRVEEPVPPYIAELIELMIERSGNDPADSLMEEIGDTLGPLVVTEDMHTIGLENSFLAGYYYLGAPLLDRIETPANQRTDVNADPDPYMQTIPVEMGTLLDDIYQCAEMGGGTLVAVFPDEITRTECQLMITYLAQNKIAVLIQAGLPDGTRIAHKHGWIIEVDGLLHTMSDTGIVYTPGGNYILVIFFHDPVQLYFDPSNQLMAQLSSSVYYYFNLGSQ